MTVRSRLSVGLLTGTLVFGWSMRSAAQAVAGITAAVTQDHAGHAARAPADESGAAQQPTHTGPPPAEEAGLPPVTDADRAAAFPDVRPHGMLDEVVNYLVLFDQLEWQGTAANGGASWDNSGWVGYDVHRFWFRTEGDVEDGQVEDASVDLLYGRAFSRWWDVVAGVRQEVGSQPSRTWAAVGIQGLAPYWFEIDATLYAGASGRTEARVQAEYELLVTNRLVLQPRVELDLYGKADPARGIGAGLSRTEAGLRLRYEIRREIAPYVGVMWMQTFGGTADFARAAGREPAATRLAGGVRAWF